MTAPRQAPRWVGHHGPRTLGVVMIVRNEVENLPPLFESIARVADEVVVVDTGSTDGTLALCKRWGVTLLHDRWRDDFSRARNRSVQAARARYLLWLDADDRLPEETQRELVRMRDGGLPPAGDRAYLFEVRNTTASGAMGDAFLQLRLFPRRPGVRFRNAVHEQVTESLVELGVELLPTELVVEHTGYADREAVVEKARRNEVLLRAALQADPGDVHALVHMAQTLAEQRQFQPAEERITDAIHHASGAAEHGELLPEMHVLRALYRIGIGNHRGAVYDLERAAHLREGWGLPPALLAEVHAREDDWEAAWRAAGEAGALSFPTGRIALPVARARSAAERVAATCLQRRGDASGAAERLESALRLDPTHPEARLELGQLLLDEERYAEAREVLEPLGRDEAALPLFEEVSAAIGLARAMTGDAGGAGACLAPFLDLYAAELGGAAETGPLELAGALLRHGHPGAARNMLTLYQKTA